jgi:hypothetical protein
VKMSSKFLKCTKVSFRHLLMFPYSFGKIIFQVYVMLHLLVYVFMLLAEIERHLLRVQDIASPFLLDKL